MTLFQLRQSALLLITALIWGSTFVAQSTAMEALEPFPFTSSRMCLGMLCLLPLVAFFRARQRSAAPARWQEKQGSAYKRNLFIGSVCCGLCILGGESLQQFGLADNIDVGKAGFITALYIVVVPVLGLFIGKRAGMFVWAAVAVAVAGLWYLCVPPGGFTVVRADFLVFLCAFVFSLHILVIGHFVTKVDGVELACGQFAVGSVLSAILTLATGELPSLSAMQAALPQILWAGVMSNGVAYTLQIVGQRGMNDTVASLIMSLESAFALLFGWLLLGEVLSARELLGCALMAGAVVLAQLPDPRRAR